MAAPFQHVILSLRFCLCGHHFTGNFLLALAQCPVISADFLHKHKLLVDVSSRHLLLLGLTSSIPCCSTTASPSFLSLVSSTCTSLLHKYPRILSLVFWFFNSTWSLTLNPYLWPPVHFGSLVLDAFLTWCGLLLLVQPTILRLTGLWRAFIRVSKPPCRCISSLLLGQNSSRGSSLGSWQMFAATSTALFLTSSLLHPSPPWLCITLLFSLTHPQ